MKQNISDAFNELISKYNDKEIELNKTYWVSEWSWNPICDGYSPSEEVIRFKQTIDGINVYTTGKNYRYYYAWDICDTEEECEEITNYKNSFAYDWCSVEHIIPSCNIDNILK